MTNNILPGNVPEMQTSIGAAAVLEPPPNIIQRTQDYIRLMEDFDNALYECERACAESLLELFRNILRGCTIFQRVTVWYDMLDSTCGLLVDGTPMGEYVWENRAAPAVILLRTIEATLTPRFAYYINGRSVMWQ